MIFRLAIAATLGLAVGASVNLSSAIENGSLDGTMAASYGCQPAPYISRCRWNGVKFFCPENAIRKIQFYAYSHNPSASPLIVIKPNL